MRSWREPWSPDDRRRERGVALRSALTIITLVPLLGTVAFLALLSLWGRRSIVEEHARPMVHLSLARVQDRIQLLLAKVDTQAALLEEALDSGDLAPATITKHFESLIDRFDQSGELAYLGFAVHDTGSYWMLERIPETRPQRIRLRVIDPTDPQAPTQREAFHENGQLGPYRDGIWDGYDPRQRPYYQRAEVEKRPTWTDTYPFWENNERGPVLGITHARPYANGGGRIGVIDVDFEIEASLVPFLTGLQGELRGTICLIERSRDGTDRIIAVSQRAGHETRVASEQLLNQGAAIRDGELLRFDIEGEPFLGGFAALLDPHSPRWRIGFALAENEVAQPILANLQQVTLVGLLASLLAAYVALRLADRLSQPFMDLVARLRGEKAQPLGSTLAPVPITEVSELRSAYHEMNCRVRARQQELESEISQRRAAERELQERQRKLAIVNRALVELAHDRALLAGDLEAGLKNAATIAASAANADRVGIWRLAEDHSRLSCAELFERTHDRHSSGAVIQASDRPSYFAALERERVVSAHDARNDPRTREFAPDYLEVHGIGSMLDVSIRSGPLLIGVVCFERIGPPNPWTAEDEIFADAFADLVMLAIESNERRRAEHEVRDLAASLERRVAERTQELELANARLSELDRLKSHFLATMSHELRTPLNSIIGFTSLVKSGMAGPVNDEQRKQLEMVYGSARHLLGLINDLLDLSRIESGRMELFVEPFAPAGVIDEVAAMLAPQLALKKLALNVAIEDRTTTIVGDRKKFFQVLLNLATNAVKFTERGEVRIEARASGGRYEVSVRDTGIGIRPEHMALLFEAFRQVDGSARRVYEGTGLGLYLCRKLVGLVRGEIHAESEFGRGSHFWFHVPLALDVPAALEVPVGRSPA